MTKVDLDSGKLGNKTDKRKLLHRVEAQIENRNSVFICDLVPEQTVPYSEKQ